jgi:cell fate (sporulation/competence/biofilm development) regulator YlbF (YheA/YmcA/DUF963 family)
MTKNSVALQTGIEILGHEVHVAAQAFAQSIGESAAFQAYEQSAELLRWDEPAQQAILAFQEKQQSLQMLLRLNAVSPEDRAELERLQRAFLDRPSVVGYLKAQEELNSLCQAAANLLSERIGLSFTAACGSGCC